MWSHQLPWFLAASPLEIDTERNQNFVDQNSVDIFILLLTAEGLLNSKSCQDWSHCENFFRTSMRLKTGHGKKEHILADSAEVTFNLLPVTRNRSCTQIIPWRHLLYDEKLWKYVKSSSDKKEAPDQYYRGLITKNYPGKFNDFK